MACSAEWHAIPSGFNKISTLYLRGAHYGLTAAQFLSKKPSHQKGMEAIPLDGVRLCSAFLVSTTVCRNLISSRKVLSKNHQSNVFIRRIVIYRVHNVFQRQEGGAKKQVYRQKTQQNNKVKRGFRKKTFSFLSIVLLCACLCSRRHSVLPWVNSKSPRFRGGFCSSRIKAQVLCVTCACPQIYRDYILTALLNSGFTGIALVNF